MRGLRLIRVDGRQRKDGTWLLWASNERQSVLDAQQLRVHLFAWHRPSLYGTLLEPEQGGPNNAEALRLSALDAIDYFAAPACLKHLTVEWSETLRQACETAALLRRALTRGWFRPDGAAWQRTGQQRWRLDVPETERSSLPTLPDAPDLPLTPDQWLDLALGQMTEQEPDVAAAWSALSVEQPLLRLQAIDGVADSTERVNAAEASEQAAADFLGQGDFSLDEERWLTAVGWKKDDVPFRTCFQLVEPDAEAGISDWQLRLVLQDKERAEPMLAYEPEPQAIRIAELPETWREKAAERLPGDIRQAAALLPELRASEEDRLIPVLTDDQAWDFLQEGGLRLLQAGFSVFLPTWWEELQRLQPKLKAKLKSSPGSAGPSLFGMDQITQFDWRIAIGGVELDEEEFARLTKEKKRLIYFRGRWIQLDPAFVAQIQQAMHDKGNKGLSFREILELHLLGGSEVGEPGGEAEASGDEHASRLRIEVELNAHMARLMGRLRQTDTIPMVAPSAELRADLRNYQREGVSWLLFMRQFGLGACLADDMGLGKTLQFIAYLLKAREEAGEQPSMPDAARRRVRKKSAAPVAAASDSEEKPFPAPASEERVAAERAGNAGKELESAGPSLLGKASGRGPALLICPTSVLGNWQKELDRFAPTLNVYLHYGPQRLKGEALVLAIRDCDLVLTSYNLAQLDEEELMPVVWDALCLDEAQNIKNAYTKQASAIRRLEARHRIALTGTPIENRLSELWSIYDFMNPGYLGSLTEFNRSFIQPIEKNRDEELVGQVQKLVRPFLLRRVKKDPAIQLDLPDKTESKAYVSLTVEQATLYENVVQSLMEKIETLSGIEKKGLILATLTRLKQICDHPALFMKEKETLSWQERSSKVERLLELIQELRDEGDNCLIFTQFVEMGHLLKAIIERERGESVLFLHGGVPKKQRDRMIEQFQNESLPQQERGSIFILSLKAGGTGLNLTAANHVFHFDRWWNPAVENQATDRAFRIGQTRNVQVHKFVTLGTLEEKIDEMIERKQGLSEQIVGSGENWVTEMSTQELRELFALRREWIGR